MPPEVEPWGPPPARPPESAWGPPPSQPTPANPPAGPGGHPAPPAAGGYPPPWAGPGGQPPTAAPGGYSAPPSPGGQPPTAAPGGYPAPPSPGGYQTPPPGPGYPPPPSGPGGYPQPPWGQPGPPTGGYPPTPGGYAPAPGGYPPGGWGPPPPGGWGPPPSSGGWPTAPPTAWGAPPPAWSPAPPVGTYAGFGARLAARLIDGLILTVPTVFAIVILAAVVPTEDGFCTVNGDIEPCTVPTPGGVLLIVAAIVVGVAAYLAYYIGLIGRRGATLGQRAMHIEVVDQVTGNTIGLGRATGRYFMSIVSGWVCYLGYLWMLWDERKQTWQDKVVNSVVIRR